MSSRWRSQARRGLPATCALALWVGLLANALLTRPTTRTPAAELWLCAVTVTAALATLASAARRDSPSRVVWLLLGLGLSGYAAGFVVVSYVSVGEAGGPWGLNRSDTASLLLYPCAYAGLLLLTRDRVSRQERLSRGSVLDGAVVLTGGAAVAIAAPRCGSTPPCCTAAPTTSSTHSPTRSGG